MRDVISAWLTKEGNECLQATNGLEGIGVVRREPLDAVIVDLMMRYNGIMTIRMIREEYPKLPIVAMSGASTDRLDLAGAAGADVLLRKPFNMDTLRKGLTDAVNKPREEKAEPTSDH